MLRVPGRVAVSESELPGPTNAAPDSARRNRPQFTDLPIPDDTANLREGPDLHPDCLPLLPLVGMWRGTGVVEYPTIDGPYSMGQQLVFAHDGRPFLSYESRAWLLGPVGALLAVPLSLLLKALLVEADPRLSWALPLISGHPSPRDDGDHEPRG